jgi:predicted aconitase with swiveling domain
MTPGPYLLKGLLVAGAIVAAGILLARAPGTTAPVADTDTVHVSVFAGGRDVRLDSQSFRGGEANSVMGGIRMDLRDAAIEGDEAVIEIDAVMGGVELRVPENWVVVYSEVDSFLGGVEDRTRSVPSENSQRLVLRGTVFMGGLEIRN